MATDAWRNRLLIPWLSLPLLATIYLVLWERLPAQLAVHFGLNGVPDLYMPRGFSLVFDLVVLLALLTGCSLKLWRQRRYLTVEYLVAFYAVIAVASAIFIAILWYNVTS